MDFNQFVQSLVNSGQHRSYTAGLTNDPDRRKTEHGNPTFWRHWVASSQDHAHELERWLLSLGFKGAQGGDRTNSVFVYIYR